MAAILSAAMARGALRARLLAVSLHDVAPQTWPACLRLLRMVDEVAGVPVTLLVTPDYHRKGLATFDAAYRAGLERRLVRGDELALHGWNHLDELPLDGGALDTWRRTVLTAREGEFSALPYEECRRRLEAGRDWFEAWGWPLHGFVAPAWLLGGPAWQALAHSGLRYTTTRRALHLLPGGRAYATRTLTYSLRSALRARLSLLWNSWQALPLHRDAIARLALHPLDASHPQALHRIALVLRTLADRREALTKAEVAARLAGNAGERAQPGAVTPGRA